MPKTVLSAAGAVALALAGVALAGSPRLESLLQGHDRP